MKPSNYVGGGGAALRPYCYSLVLPNSSSSLRADRDCRAHDLPHGPGNCGVTTPVGGVAPVSMSQLDSSGAVAAEDSRSMSLRSGLLAALTVLALLVAPTAAAEPGDPQIPIETAPVIQGAARVGMTLTFAEVDWSETDVTTTHEWRRSGESAPDPDPTDNAYTLTAADLGAEITVVATGIKAGFSDTDAPSNASGPVLRGILTLEQRPIISGAARVGTTLTVEEPIWREGAVSTSYQWQRNGVEVSTRTQYLLTSKDVGAAISVRATSRKNGYEDAVATSTPTAKVAKIPATVTVGGTSARVGALRLSIRVSASEVPTGTVSIRQGTKLLKTRLALKDGRATFSKTGITPGRYTYTVRYAGSPRVAAATDTLALSIKAKAKPSIALKATTGVGKVKIGITVAAPGQPPLGGTAYVKEGRKTLKTTIKVVRGRATWSASGIKPGRHTYLVGYRGTSQVRSGTKSVTVRVPAPAKLVSYANCAAMQEVHPHGVGRTGARDSTSGTPVTTFLVNTKLYEYNDGKDDKPGEKDLDRDNDGIACEKL